MDFNKFIETLNTGDKIVLSIVGIVIIYIIYSWIVLPLKFDKMNNHLSDISEELSKIRRSKEDKEY